MIGLPGRTRGHAAVAVDAGDRWVLHAGDCFHHRARLDGTGRTPRSPAALEYLVAADWSALEGNRRRLAELHARERGRPAFS
jgi:glyoxylase-like metal-dependent hydrolase (beta-lactamase superfamily II)